MNWRVPCAALLLIAAATGCGSSDKPPSESAPASVVPAVVASPSQLPGSQNCAVIKDGVAITRDLVSNGCAESKDEMVAFVTVDCKDGRVFTTYADKFFGFVGDVWHKNGPQPASDPAYGRAYDECLS